MSLLSLLNIAHVAPALGLTVYIMLSVKHRVVVKLRTIKAPHATAPKGS